MKSLSRNWRWFLLLAFVAGVLLRMLFVSDMEYKEDEEFNFNQSQLVGHSIPWPWLGIGSGVYIPNPGMSVWVFVILGRLFHATTPTELASALQIFSLLGIALILPLALGMIQDHQEREPWLWAFALSLVNPFAILYQRKLWPEPFLPFFCMLMWIGWWRRERRWAAFLWGLVGAWLGQIHMSGFFLAGGVFLWTLMGTLMGKLRGPPKEAVDVKVRWDYWILGSVLGALPLIPWFIAILAHPTHEPLGGGWAILVQLKYWVFWVTDALGLHLGNPLGLLRGESNFAQISDFIRTPIIAGQPTYLVGLAHLITLITGLTILLGGIKRGGLKFFKGSTPTRLAQNAVLFGCGILLTVTTVNIRRYYMMVTFPFEFIFLARLALSLPKPRGRQALLCLWAAELVMSAGFVAYIHTHGGSTQGDYGEAYHLILERTKH